MSNKQKEEKPKQSLTAAERKAEKAIRFLYHRDGHSPRVEDVAKRIKRSYSWTARLMSNVVDKGHAEEDPNRYQTIRPVQ